MSQQPHEHSARGAADGQDLETVSGAAMLTEGGGGKVLPSGLLKRPAEVKP